MSSTVKQGIIFALLAAGISGVSIFYNKLVVVRGIDPTIFNIIKNGGTALMVSVLIVSTSSRDALAKLSKTKWLKLLSIAIIGGSIPFVLFFDGLKTVPAINASLIHKTLFIWVAILAIPLLKEKLTRVQILGYGFVFLSNFFIGGFRGFSANSAELAILIATLFWSLENIMAKIVLRDTDSKIVVWGRMFLGTVILIGYAAFSHKLGLLAKLTPGQLVPVLGSIVLLSGYVLSWYKALSLAPATVVTAILILATPITNVLSAIFVTHTIDPTQLINLVLTIAGILFIVFFSAKVTRYEHPRISPVQ